MTVIRTGPKRSLKPDLVDLPWFTLNRRGSCLDLAARGCAHGDLTRLWCCLDPPSPPWEPSHRPKDR